MTASSRGGKADLLRRANFELDRRILVISIPSDLLYSVPTSAQIYRPPARILESTATLAREMAGQLHALKDRVGPLQTPMIESVDALAPSSGQAPSVGLAPSVGQPSEKADFFDHLLILHTSVAHSFAELDHALLGVTDRDLGSPSRLLSRGNAAQAELAAVDSVDESTGLACIAGVAASQSFPTQGSGTRPPSDEAELLGVVLERDLLDQKRADLDELIGAVELLELQGFDGGEG